jgi:hypothetical protein
VCRLEETWFSRIGLLITCVGGRVVCSLGVKLFYSQPAHETATNIEWLLTEAVLIQFVSPDDEHDVLETFRELQIEINT